MKNYYVLISHTNFPSFIIATRARELFEKIIKTLLLNQRQLRHRAERKRLKSIFTAHPPSTDEPFFVGARTFYGPLSESYRVCRAKFYLLFLALHLIFLTSGEGCLSHEREAFSWGWNRSINRLGAKAFVELWYLWNLSDDRGWAV